jgi:hypothetical protein
MQETSVVIIQVFHDNGKRLELRAETTVDAAHCLQVESQGIRMHSRSFSDEQPLGRSCHAISSNLGPSDARENFQVQECQVDDLLSM